MFLLQIGTPVTVNLSNHFVDPDGDVLTYTTTAGTVHGATLTVPTAVEGTIAVTVTANDGKQTVNATFTITVTTAQLITCC